MKKKRSYRPRKKKAPGAKEPIAPYAGKPEWTLRFFSSFEEMNEADARESAALSYDERLTFAEDLRKQVFHKYLLPDGSWPPVSGIFRIMNPYVSKTGE